MPNWDCPNCGSHSRNGHCCSGEYPGDGHWVEGEIYKSGYSENKHNSKKYKETPPPTEPLKELNLFGKDYYNSKQEGADLGKKINEKIKQLSYMKTKDLNILNQREFLKAMWEEIKKLKSEARCDNERNGNKHYCLHCEPWGE